MKKFKFSPFRMRIGNLEVTNFYKDKNGKEVPTQSHISKDFDCFEIIKWEKNLYYGKNPKYNKNSEFIITKMGSISSKGCGASFIDESCFENPEHCLVLSFFENVYDEDSLCVRSVGDRPFILEPKEIMIYNRLVLDGIEYITKQLRKNEK